MDISAIKPANLPTYLLLLETKQLENLIFKMAALEIKIQQVLPTNPPRTEWQEPVDACW